MSEPTTKGVVTVLPTGEQFFGSILSLDQATELGFNSEQTDLIVVGPVVDAAGRHRILPLAAVMIQPIDECPDSVPPANRFD